MKVENERDNSIEDGEWRIGRDKLRSCPGIDRNSRALDVKLEIKNVKLMINRRYDPPS